MKKMILTLKLFTFLFMQADDYHTYIENLKKSTIISEKIVKYKTVSSTNEKSAGSENSFTYTLQYPHFVSEGKFFKYLNLYLETYVRHEREAFEVEMINPQKFTNLKYQLQLTCDVKYVSPSLVSLVWEDRRYDGGAHSMYSYYSLNYAILDGFQQTIDFESIFGKNHMVREHLALLCVRDLKEQRIFGKGHIDDSFLEPNGHKQLMEKLDTMFFTPEGIGFVFEHYAVSSFAAGEQTVVIPYAKLKSFLNPNSPQPIVTLFNSKL